jgi:carboxyl-terminal processing protease
MIEKALDKAQKDSKNNIKGIVLDVRNNPGGLLDQAVSITDLFLDKGEIVSTRSKNAEDTVKYNAKEGDIAKGLPIVVLVNDGSASASEIVAGALQDHKRAVIVGEKTFGKGSVQTVIPLGKYGAMRLTTARYYTPSGRSIQATGIVPDVEVKPAKVEEIDKGVNFSEAEFGNALKNDAEETPKKQNEKVVDDELKKDYQLMRAVDLVKALSIYNSYDFSKK